MQANDMLNSVFSNSINSNNTSDPPLSQTRSCPFLSSPKPSLASEPHCQWPLSFAALSAPDSSSLCASSSSCSSSSSSHRTPAENPIGQSTSGYCDNIGNANITTANNINNNYNNNNSSCSNTQWQAEFARKEAALTRALEDEKAALCRLVEAEISMQQTAAHTTLQQQRADLHAATQQLLYRENEFRKEKEEWESQEDRLRVAQLPDKITLNIGGQHFACALSDLTRIPNTFFAAMFSGRWPLHADTTDGSFFVNRSPRVFAYIMEYMRGERIQLGGLSSSELAAIERDADFYGLVSLEERVKRVRANGEEEEEDEATESGDEERKQKSGKVFSKQWWRERRCPVLVVIGAGMRRAWTRVKESSRSRRFSVAAEREEH